MTVKDKKAAVLKYLKKYLNIADPSGYNYEIYEKWLGVMDDTTFLKWGKSLKMGTAKLAIYTPNMKHPLQVRDLIATTEALGVQIFHRLWMVDKATGRRFLTPEKYPVIKMYARRQQQFLDEKISCADSDRIIDTLTGQVTSKDRAASFSAPETQIGSTRGLYNMLVEFLKVRGGDITALGEFKRQAEETGKVSIASFTTNSRARSAVIVGVLLKSMLYDNNM